MVKKELTSSQKRSGQDLKIIIWATIVPVIIFLAWGETIMEFVRQGQINIWLKFLPVAMIQFGLAGLGSMIVFIYRKESLYTYGITKRNLCKTIILSALVCIPSLVFMGLNGEIQGYFPLQGCIFTGLFLESNLFNAVFGYGIIVIIWGVMEGFNYVVISKKINDRYPHKNCLLNWGAIVCGLACILIHGMVGFDWYTMFEAVTTFILIYGMLLVRDKYQNAWGVIFIFVFFWNGL